MSSNKMATKSDLQSFYNRIFPYLGGSADAGFTPIGSIIAIMGVTAPANYLACNGQIVKVADYPELANYFEQQFGTKYKFGGSGTTFGIPDLRGEFLRGTGTNSHSGQGNGSTVGTHQNATIHEFISVGANSLYSEDRDSTRGNVDYVVSNTTTYNEFTPASSHKSGGGAWSGSNGTSRPTNTSILWCIATKDIYLNPSLDYSTSEKVVGKWIDGSTLYQKTVNFGTLPNTTEKNVAHNISNLSQVVHMQAILYSTGSSAIYSPLSYIQIGNDNTRQTNADVAWYATKTNIAIRTADNKSTLSCYVTLQYTKTK
jgi:microcystin-dependent protein